jgi:hypothetical protein
VRALRGRTIRAAGQFNQHRSGNVLGHRQRRRRNAQLFAYNPVLERGERGFLGLI